MKYSYYAKIIDPNSEYYGQVFEVTQINFEDDCVWVKYPDDYEKCYDFSQIQFCVTKDNEPVKMGEEVVSIGDWWNKAEGEYITGFYELNGDIFFTISTGHSEFFKRIYEEEHLEPLHPTNKVKITAGGKEYWISREEFNRLTK